MEQLGFQHSTPNFRLDTTTDVPSDADFGDVETSMAQHVTLGQLHGPWLVMTDVLQGELFVDTDGFAMYRPAAGLGYGVGTIQVTNTSLPSSGPISTFDLALEVYAYDNTTANPPLTPLVLHIEGIISIAKAQKSNYETMTLNGRPAATSSVAGGASSSSSQGSSTAPFNAAKLTPWSPATATPPKWTGPSLEVREGFAQLFSHPLRLTSHMQRLSSSSSSSAASPPAPVVSSSLLSSNTTTTTSPKHFDLTPYKVGSHLISNVYYIPNYLSPHEQVQMMQQLRDTPEAFKSKLTKRTVQEWGCTMCPTCDKSFVSESNLPPWTEAVCDMMLFDGIYSPTQFPNNVRIHEYEVGEGIAPHCDGPIYVPKVAILSLASTSVMHFYSRRDPYDQPMEHYNDTFKFDGPTAKEIPAMSVVLEPGSMLIFEQDAYTHHPHGISDLAVDSLAPDVAGEVVNRHLMSDPQMTEVRRQYRVGVTIRNLLPRCNHEPERAEYQLKRAWMLYQQQAAATLGFVLPPPPQLTATTAVLRSTPSVTAARPAVTTTTAATAPPAPLPTFQSSSSTAPPVAVNNIAELNAKVDRVLAQQQDILSALRELQNVVASSAASQATYQRETSTVLNHLSTTVLQLESAVEELADPQDQ